MNQLKNIFLTEKDKLQLILFWIGGLILCFYGLILTFAPVIRTLNWKTPVKWEQWIAFAAWSVICFIVHKFSARYLPNRDPYILPIIFLLSGLGLLTIFRLSISFGWRQLQWFVISSIFLLIGVKYRNFLTALRKYKYLWLTLGLLVTVLTFFMGIYPGGEGPRLWLGCCGLYFQPSEPLKLLFIIYLAAFFADNWPMRKDLSVLLIPSLVMVGASIFILISQKDLGTATIFLIIYAFFIFIVSGKKRTIFIFVFLLIIAGYLGYKNFNVIQIRMNGWINPWLDPSGGSYQIIQSLQAIAAGHFLGSGPGMGSPGIIPVAISDFIYPAIVEELGMVGAIFIISAFAFLSYRGFSIAIKSRNQFQRLLASGVTVFINLQAILIIGGNIRLLPLTGVTLPFLSYGGSSLLTLFVAALILLEISQNQSSRTILEAEAKPYLLSFSAFLAGFLALGLLTSFWGIIRSNQLLNRPDNFRKVINDRYVPRGNLLDKQNQPILETIGERGNFRRILLEPSLSTTVGYNHPIIGQSGLEEDVDTYLRGEAGLPASEIWWNELLYSRPPDGLDIRTTIDLSHQKLLVNLLNGYHGAALIMNAKSGEISAIWSSPSYNPDLLEENYEELLNDKNAALINRVSQGKYGLGNLSSVFLLGYLIEKNGKIDGQNFSKSSECAIQMPIDQKNVLQTSIKHGCNNAYIYLESLLENNNLQVFQQFRFDEEFGFELPFYHVELPDPFNEKSFQSVLISPLQVARSVAVFSTGGKIPYPKLTNAVNIPDQGWVVFSSKDPVQILKTSSSIEVSNFLSRTDFPAWETSASNFSVENPNNWYVTGTLSDWQGTPVVLVIILENGTAKDAQTIGRNILEQVLTSSVN